MQNRLINLSLLINEYKDRVYDLISYTSCSKDQKVKDELFCDTFINIFRSIKDTKVKYPVHLVVYDKAKDLICKGKKVQAKKVPSIKELKAPVDISSVHPVELKGVDLAEILEHLDPKDRLIAVMMLRHHANINELASILSTSTGSILARIGRVRTELTRAIYSTLKNPKEAHNYEHTKLCFSTRSMEPQFSLGMLPKDEQTKINRHISKCTACRNFYTWNERVSDLFVSAPEQNAPETASNMIFERLQGKVIDDTAIHYVRTGWKTRLAILLTLLLSLAGAYYYFFHKAEVSRQQKALTQIQTHSSELVYRTLIKISIPASKQEVDSTLTKMEEIIGLFSYDAGHTIQANDPDGLKKEFSIQKQSKDSMLEKIKAFDKASVTESMIDEKAPDDIIKVEMDIIPNGS